MPPKFKTGLVLACMLVLLYVLFSNDDRPLAGGDHAVDQQNGHKDGYGAKEDVWVPSNKEFGVPVEALRPLPTYEPQSPSAVPPPLPETKEPKVPEVPAVDEGLPELSPVEEAPKVPAVEEAIETPDVEETPQDLDVEEPPLDPAAEDAKNTPTDQDLPVPLDSPDAEDISVPEQIDVPLNGTSLQQQFMDTYEVLGSYVCILVVCNSTDTFRTQDVLSSMYGHTLNTLIDNGQHAGLKRLTPTEEPTLYSDKPTYVYNPYPDYNSKKWKYLNQGEYKACQGYAGKIADLLVFSGHPEIFDRKGPHLGSNTVLDIDSNLCWERETRLGSYGYSIEGAEPGVDDPSVEKRDDVWDLVDWGGLQASCLELNANRYNKSRTESFGGPSGIPGQPTPAQLQGNSTWPLVDLNDENPAKRRADESTGQETAEAQGYPRLTALPQQRTAVLVRTHSDQLFTENDKQNIRALVTELGLRSGGEYEVFLVVQIKNETLKFDKNAEDKQKALENIPQEFQSMTVLWSDAQMRQLYQFVPEKVNNVHQSQWLSVQAFSQIYSKFDFYWNWEFDSRYTGHYYNLLDKISTFAKNQPRKGLWERNERFFVEEIHFRWPAFQKTVEKVSGLSTVWGPVTIPNLEPVGPARPDYLPERDTYEWGVGEDADYISLAPMFNPLNTTWVGKNDVWGYDGPHTPRRATIGTQARCSKKLLDAMHYENMRGNHVSSEMTPSTVALLHGLKAVYAPIPVYFDRAWQGKDLDRFFNPGPQGVSGSHEESPFGWGKEGRFKGSTWYYRADPPQRLYNNWLGWEDTGIGGAEVCSISSSSIPCADVD